jgi:hypothetical protein
MDPEVGAALKNVGQLFVARLTTLSGKDRDIYLAGQRDWSKLVTLVCLRGQDKPDAATLKAGRTCLMAATADRAKSPGALTLILAP